MKGFIEQSLNGVRRGPLMLRPASSNTDLADLVGSNVRELTERLLGHGAILFRSFDLPDLAAFERFVAALSLPRMNYVYGSTPRTRVGERIFTATEYPPALEIPLHNECAYQREWPLKLAFFCQQPSDSGGETPLADMREVHAALGSTLLDELETRGVRYVRTYHPHVDVPWQQVFQTTDPTAVTRFCNEHQIVCEWLDAEVLRTVQVCQGTARHPTTGERVFFNQAHLFHVSSLPGDDARIAVALFGRDRLPRQTYFGDGTEISVPVLEAIRDAFRSAAIQFPWQGGDVLLLDNMQFAHGRRAFRGRRTVLAALLEPHARQWTEGMEST